MKICDVRVGVQIPQVEGLTYYSPRSLEKKDCGLEKPIPTKRIRKPDPRLVEFCLAGFNLLEHWSEVRNKTEGVVVVDSFIAAWKDSKTKLVGSFP